jgi:hypothetical protein
MKPTWIFVIVGILICLTIDWSPEESRSLPPREFAPAERPAASLRPQQQARALPVARNQPSAPPPSSAAAVAGPSAHRTVQTYALPEFATETELAISAALTQNRAATELERLERLLDLSEAQADEIFPILARHSTAYHPALRIRIGRSETGRPRPLPNTSPRAPRSAPDHEPEPDMEEIDEILTPPQIESLVAEEIAADEWWTEIIDELASPPPNP